MAWTDPELAGRRDELLERVRGRGSRLRTRRRVGVGGAAGAVVALMIAPAVVAFVSSDREPSPTTFAADPSSAEGGAVAPEPTTTIVPARPRVAVPTTGGRAEADLPTPDAVTPPTITPPSSTVEDQCGATTTVPGCTVPRPTATTAPPSNIQPVEPPPATVHAATPACDPAHFSSRIEGAPTSEGNVSYAAVFTNTSGAPCAYTETSVYSYILDSSGVVVAEQPATSSLSSEERVVAAGEEVRLPASWAPPGCPPEVCPPLDPGTYTVVVEAAPFGEARAELLLTVRG